MQPLASLDFFLLLEEQMDLPPLYQSPPISVKTKPVFFSFFCLSPLTYNDKWKVKNGLTKEEKKRLKNKILFQFAVAKIQILYLSLNLMFLVP